MNIFEPLELQCKKEQSSSWKKTRNLVFFKHRTMTYYFSRLFLDSSSQRIFNQTYWTSLQRYFIYKWFPWRNQNVCIIFIDILAAGAVSLAEKEISSVPSWSPTWLEASVWAPEGWHWFLNMNKPSFSSIGNILVSQFGVCWRHLLASMHRSRL